MLVILLEWIHAQSSSLWWGTLLSKALEYAVVGCQGWGSGKAGKLSPWVSLCRIQAEPDPFTFRNNIFLVKHCDARKQGSCCGQGTWTTFSFLMHCAKHQPKHTPTQKVRMVARRCAKPKWCCVLFVRGREWAFTGQRPQARHVTGWLHFCRDAELAVFYPSPQNVSLVWQLFQTENNRGSKDSGRDFGLPPNCLENLDRGPVPQIELSPEILMPKSWLSVHWC